MIFVEFYDEDGLLSVNFSETKLITGDDENGVWELQTIFLQDEAGNSQWYNRNDISNPSQYDFQITEEDLIILPDQQNIEIDQMWRINFNREFSKDEVEDIYIDEVMLFSTMTDGSTKFVNVEVEWLPEEKQAIITPIEDYMPGEAYHLIIILSNNNHYRMKFTVAAN